MKCDVRSQNILCTFCHMFFGLMARVFLNAGSLKVFQYGVGFFCALHQLKVFVRHWAKSLPKFQSN